MEEAGAAARALTLNPKLNPKPYVRLYSDLEEAALAAAAARALRAIKIRGERVGTHLTCFTTQFTCLTSTKVHILTAEEFAQLRQHSSGTFLSAALLSCGLTILSSSASSSQQHKQ